MILPTHGEFDSHVRALDRFVNDPCLKGGKPRLLKPNKHGIQDLEVYSGGFCRVYPIVLPGNKAYGLRVWHRAIESAEKRYEHIDEYLTRNRLPYFVDCQYVPQGITVKGQLLPILRMEWAKGEPLNLFLEKHVRDSRILLQTASEMVKMFEALHRCNISHGDLQDGNIIIQHAKKTSGDYSVEIKLIDYDSLCVPSLEGMRSEIVGLEAYQHPQRRKIKKASRKVDYFSELVIYLSLLAYAEDPSLWKGRKQEGQLLFSGDDFKDPSRSEMLGKLDQLSPSVEYLAGQLRKFCGKDIAHLSPLEQVVEQAPQSPRPSVQLHKPIFDFDTRSMAGSGISSPRNPAHSQGSSGLSSIDWSHGQKLQYSCPYCGTVLDPTWRFCANCGGSPSDIAASAGTKTGGSAGKIDHKSVPQISAGCPYCGFDADPGAIFCPACGVPLSGGSPSDVAASPKAGVTGGWSIAPATDGWSIVPADMGRIIKGVFIHLAIYLAVNTLLVIIWALTGAGFPWFVFPLGIWGFCVWVHFLRTRRV